MSSFEIELSPPLNNLPLCHDAEVYAKSPSEYSPSPDIVNRYLSCGETVVTRCIKDRNDDAVIALLDAGADPHLPNQKGAKPFAVAAKYGSIKLMERLYELDSGVTKDCREETRSSALLIAAHFGQLESVKFLLDRSANPNEANHNSTTALMRAAQEGHLEIVRCLVDAKADVNAKNVESMTALMLSSQRGHVDVVRLLVGAGADIDHQTGGHWRAKGASALMLACHRGHVACVEALLELGANMKLLEKDGETAKQLTLNRIRKREEKHTDMSDMAAVGFTERLKTIVELLRREEKKRGEVLPEKDLLDHTIHHVEGLNLSNDWVTVERSYSLEEVMSPQRPAATQA